MSGLSDIICPYGDRPRADAVLFGFIDICYTRDIPVFLALGTALGFHRSGLYLPGDIDIDVFILCSPNTRLSLLNHLSTVGYLINSIPGAAPSLNTHAVFKSILLDIWHKQRKDFMSFYQGNCFVTYKNRRLRIPFNIEKYLSLIYGDWKTPAQTRANCFGP